MAKEDEQAGGQTETAGPIETVEQLKKAFGGLTIELETEAKKEAAKEIAALSVTGFKKTFATLYKKIAAEVTGVVDAAALKVPGFLLDPEDPFAEGAARTFAAVKRVEIPRLPIVLPFKDKASKPALESYIVRAAGGGDNERAERARAALKKCK